LMIYYVYITYYEIILENYAFPEGLLIDSDSHTVNAGGIKSTKDIWS